MLAVLLLNFTLLFIADFKTVFPFKAKLVTSETDNRQIVIHDKDKQKCTYPYNY